MIVEGPGDLFSVVGLMRSHVDWPEDKRRAPVYINIGKSKTEILAEGVIPQYLKGSAIQTFGVMLDADDNPGSTYRQICRLCVHLFPTLPPELPSDGLIVVNDDGKRFGVWGMPDNVSTGTVETFLKHLVPEAELNSWKHAQDSVRTARDMGCKCRDAHVEKAELYTWLSWQDPPGQSPGLSLTQKALNPSSPSARTFVNWFMQLYELPPRSTLFP